ncbi:iron donor protein CyaY [Chitinimonas lacunae]|uniref:Iron-sulfur cluster assembly protein CyaY n=1 Tax=Chitinimonas lacunae TaxID=1963018 RepID=A0ABV8MSV3_9NEIS
MTDSEFENQTARVFARIEHAFDLADCDADLSLNGGVLEIEFDDGAKIIINRHAPLQELWIAARSGGFHYRFDQGLWRNTRDDGEFFAQLTELVRVHTDAGFSF